MTGNKNIDTVLIALATLASLGTVGIFFYTQSIFERPLPDDNIEKEALVSDSKQSAHVGSYKLDSMIINLHSRKSRLRFLDLEIHLKPFKSGQEELLDKNKTYLYDTIIDTAGQMRPDELNTLYGKVLLESRIKKKVNQFFNKAIIKEIFFSKFVVQ